MNSQLKNFEGMRAGSAYTKCSCPRVQLDVGMKRVGVARYTLQVLAMKKSKKKKQIVLLDNVQHVGQKGQLVEVAMGYWRNYLGPQGLAVQATAGMLQKFKEEEETKLQKEQEVKKKAENLAVALQTIGKFVVKKKAGEEDRIYGSVTSEEISEAIYMQTGQKLDKSKINLPEIKTLGDYTATVDLHPEVVGSFKVIVQREKESR